MGLSLNRLLRRHGFSVMTACAVLVVYLLVLRSLPKNVFWSPDEGGKFLQLHSIHWNRGLTYAVPYVGQRMDPSLEFFPRFPGPGAIEAFPYPTTAADGTAQFHWPIWFPLISRWAVAACGLTGLYIVPLLSGWMLALLSGWLAYRFAPRLAPLTIALVGLATPVFFFSLSFWEHTLASLLALFAVTMIVTRRASPWRALPLLLVATALRLEMIAAAVSSVPIWAVGRLMSQRVPASQDSAGSAALIGAAASRYRWVARALAAGAVGALVVLFVAFLTPRHQNFLVSLPGGVITILEHVGAVQRGLVGLFVNTARNEGPVVDWAVVLVVCVALCVCLVAPFIKRVRVEALLVVPALIAVLAFSVWLAFTAQSYRSLHSIFPIAPFLVVWVYAVPHAWRRHDPELLALVGFAVGYLVTGVGATLVFYMDSGGELTTGLEWGQRYVLTLYPVLAILTVLAVQAYWNSSRPMWLRITFAALVAVMMLTGVQMQIRGLRMLSANRQMFEEWDRNLRAEGPIVTDIWWFAVALTDLFTTHEIYFLRSRAQITDWAARAGAHGIDHFTFASLQPLPEREPEFASLRRLPERSRVLPGLCLTSFTIVDAAAAPRP